MRIEWRAFIHNSQFTIHYSLFILLLIGLIVTPANAQEDPPVATRDIRFGMVEAFWEQPEAADLGPGWDRILFYWKEIEATPGYWNTLHVDEQWLAEAQAQGRQVVGVLINTPAWATDGNPSTGVPRGLYLPTDDPDNLWANYVRRIAEYYGERGVHHWVIWNEPDAIDHDVQFDGTLDDYMQLLKVAYMVMKESDPQAVIHLAGFTYWHDIEARRPLYLDRFLQKISTDPTAAANNHYFDILTIHVYFRSESVPYLLDETNKLLQKYGLEKPIWINETNASPNLDPDWRVERPRFQVDVDQQAWYLVHAYALGFASGAESIGTYKLIDTNVAPGGESFGILHPSGSKRPAYFAYKTLVTHLSGFEYPVTMVEERDYYVVTFPKPHGQVRIVWARTERGATVELTAVLPQAELVTAVGETSQLQAENGRYTLILEGARCNGECEIGGAPLFIVEETPPTPTPTATMPVTATPIPPANATPAATAVAATTVASTAEPTEAVATAVATPIPPTPTPEATANEAAVGNYTSFWLIGLGGLLALVLFILWRKS